MYIVMVTVRRRERSVGGLKWEVRLRFLWISRGGGYLLLEQELIDVVDGKSYSSHY